MNRGRMRSLAALALTGGTLLAAGLTAHADLVPEPTPTATATASATPSDSAAPLSSAPAATTAATPAPSSAPTASPSPSPTATPTPAATAPRLLSPAPGSNEFTVESPAMDVTNLAFVGTQTVTSGGASLTVLQFTADAATLNGLTLSDPCFTSAAVTQRWKVVHSVPAGSTAVLSGGVTLLATSLSFTPLGGSTVTYDATTLPAVGVLVPAGTLPGVQITATSLTAPSTDTHQLHIEVTTC
jgi:hypothetical protein